MIRLLCDRCGSDLDVKSHKFTIEADCGVLLDGGIKAQATLTLHSGGTTQIGDLCRACRAKALLFAIEVMQRHVATAQ